jgi:hypothetical protein
MINEALTQHALIRMAQRGIKIDDAELIMLIGTEVGDGQFVRTKDCQTFEHAVKQLIERVWRLNGKRVVLVGGRVVTAYHTSPAKERKLLRHAERTAMKRATRRQSNA